jgi:tetratricopeptide (TPR) repeat protein
MPDKKRVSPWLRGTLYVVALLFLPTFVIQLLRPDALNPKDRRPTLQTVKFQFLMDAGIVFEGLHRHESAAARFRVAEQFAEQLTDAETKYESLQEARGHLAESYMSTGRTSDAELAYAQIVKSSMDAGDTFRLKNQFDKAVPKYQDAEKFAQKLTTTKFASLLGAQRNLAGCFLALKRNADLEPVYARIITTLKNQGDPYDLELGNAYQELAMARSDLHDFSRAEQALLQANEVYDKIVEHLSEKHDPSGRDLQAKAQKDITTWYLAVCYFNEEKMDLALSTAEVAFQVLSLRVGPRSIPIGVYTVGLQAAAALNNRDQVQRWQHRLDELTPTRLQDPERPDSRGVAQVP